MDKLRLKTYKCGSDRKRGEGLRIGTVRYLPHGVKKTEYVKRNLFDIWLPTIAPSRKLLKASKNWETDTPKAMIKFFDKYETELKNNTDARQTILLLAELSKQTPIAIGCYCEDEAYCHRSRLNQIITKAAQGKWPPKK